MTRPVAPSLPTPHQVREIIRAVLQECPDARVARVGPAGVEFTYGEEPVVAEAGKWRGKALGGGGS